MLRNPIKLGISQLVAPRSGCPAELQTLFWCSKRSARRLYRLQRLPGGGSVCTQRAVPNGPTGCVLQARPGFRCSGAWDLFCWPTSRASAQGFAQKVSADLLQWPIGLTELVAHAEAKDLLCKVGAHLANHGNVNRRRRPTERS